jgi:hypothetical protein
VHNSARLDGLIEKIKSHLNDSFKPPLQARLASTAVVYNNVFHYVLKGLATGLLTALIFIALIMCFAFRSVRIGLVAMIPNILPIFICLGCIGWMGVDLEVATAMTFSIALGIAVDDTIHLISRYRLEMRKTADYRQACRAAVLNVGSALIETTTVIVGGFLIFCFASLRMNILFGLLCAFLMVLTLLADLFVTPICVMLLKPFGGKKRELPADLIMTKAAVD